MAVEDLNRRIQELSQLLLDKERELAASRTSHALLKQEDEALRAELSAAREELRNEATKCSLLEQRLKRLNEELQQARLDLNSCSTERESLNRTLGRVHEQLTSLKSESNDRGLQLTELQLYYDGVLEAKEASIQSLQSLLENQQKQFREQQELWEEQRRTLKSSLVDLSDRVAASQQLAAVAAAVKPSASAAADASTITALAEARAKLLQAEKTLVKSSEREQQLLELLKQRERHLLKLQQHHQRRRQERDVGRSGSDAPARASGRNHRSGGRVAGGGGGGGDGGSLSGGNSSSGDTAARLDVSSSPSGGSSGAGGSGRRGEREWLVVQTAMQVRHAGRDARGAAACGGEGHMQGATGTCYEGDRHTCKEERRRCEKLKGRLAEAEREGEELRAEVARLRSELLREGVGHTQPAGGNLQLADELLRAHRRIQDLETQLRRARESASSAAAAAAAAALPPDAAAATAHGNSSSRAAAAGGGGGGGGPGLLTSSEHLALVRQRLVRQRQEFEQFLERVVVAEGSRRGNGLLWLAEDLRALLEKHLTKLDTMVCMSTLPEGRRLLGGSHDALAPIDPCQQQQHQQQQQQFQHSLFVVRAAWSTLRRALVSLQEAVAAALDVSSNPAVAYLQGADFLARLMREWAVGDKAALDSAVESSISAGVALVQEAVARMQSHTVDLGVLRQQLREAQEEVAQLRLANGMVQKEGGKRLAETRQEVEELQQQLDRTRAEAAALQREAAVRASELEAVRGRAEAAEAAARRAEEAAAAVDLERARLRKVLATAEGDKGSAEAAALSREEERVRLSRALSDAHATIALLHDRLDAQQAVGSSELATLKTKIRDVVTALESPSLPQLHAMMLAAANGAAEDAYDNDPYGGGGGGGGFLTAAATGRGGSATNTPRRHGGRTTGPLCGGGAGGVLSEGGLNVLALGTKASAATATGGSVNGGGGSDDDPWVVSGSLVAALDAAGASLTAALHRVALLEVAHFEAEQGVAEVEAVRDHLASAATEMAAGRISFGGVLLNELLSMLGCAASGTAAFGPPASSAPHHHNHAEAFASAAAFATTGRPRSRGSTLLHSAAGRTLSAAAAGAAAAAPSGYVPYGGCGGGGGGTEGGLLIRSQLAAARDVGQHLTRHLKNCEGMLLALKASLPQWLELATARLAARHRTELSRLRGLLGGQLAGLRRDLRELRAAAGSSMAEAARQAEDSIKQAQLASSAADRDRAEAARHLTLLQRDLTVAVQQMLPADVTAAAAAAGVGVGGNDEATAPQQQGLASSVLAAARMVSELRAGLERLRRDMAVVVSERDAARTAAEAAATHGSLLVRSVAEVAPLPQPLLHALLSPSCSDPSASPLWTAQLRDFLAAHVAGAQAATAEALAAGEVAPLRGELARMAGELRAAKTRVAELQSQAARFLADSNSALESCRRAAGEAAAAVLEKVMAGVREEVAAVRSTVSELQEDSGQALRAVHAAWGAQLEAVRGGGTAAVAALEEVVGALQVQLGAEADAVDTARAEAEAVTREAAERSAAESARSQQLTDDLAAVRQRLGQLEEAEAALEGENRGLRRALRQRDAMVMGLLHEGG
ncbi:hypothetical protein Agub_g11759, partial [Astrephomene gubernaculifera]